jgi:hypothetical protein
MCKVVEKSETYQKQHSRVPRVRHLIISTDLFNPSSHNFMKETGLPFLEYLKTAMRTVILSCS